jgi:hypothetical protein
MSLHLSMLRSVCLWTLVPFLLSVNAFQRAPSLTFCRRHNQPSHLYSSIGGGGDNGGNFNKPPPGSDEEAFDEFLNPKEESEGLKRARQYMSETSLPISFDDNEEDTQAEEASAADETGRNSSSALVGPTSSTTGNPLLDGPPSPEILLKNPYLRVVSNLSPSDLISKFTATADPRVQQAVRATILGLIGSLPKMAFDTTTITTGQRLASLMFQLQMSGYMFKNAEYRLDLSRSLGMTNGVNTNLLLSGSEEDVEDDEEEHDPLKGKVKGKLKIRYGNATSGKEESAAADTQEESVAGMEMEVDAAAYMSELRSEVSKLREELKTTRQAKEEELRKDLLTYIRTLPQQELQSLTNTISKDVLVAMKGLVNVVLGGITDGDGEIGPDTVTEQTSESMAQLCMWQLVVGYNLRELEVREEMKNQLAGAKVQDDDNGVDFSEPGVLE